MLTPEQRAIVDTRAARVAVAAGPGSGKTHTLVSRNVALLEAGVHEDELLNLTFTRLAANGMATRLEEYRELLGARWSAKRVRLTTVHSWCLTLIRTYHDILGLPKTIVVRDGRDRVDVICHLAREADPTLKPCTSASGRKRRAESQIKKPDIQRAYRRVMLECGACDYEMILDFTLQLLRTSPMACEQIRRRHPWLLHDEAQDANPKQQAILAALAPTNRLDVGDYSQAIFSFRGAYPAGFLALAEVEGCESRSLSINFRSVPEVVEVVNRIAGAMEIPGLQQTAHRDSLGDDAVGTIESATAWGLHADITADLHRQHDAGTPWGEMAVLSPVWAPLQDLAKHLEDAGIPHSCPKNESDVWRSEEARWLVNLLRVAIEPHDHLSLYSALHHAAARCKPWEWAELRSESVRSGEPILAVALRKMVRPAAADLVLGITETRISIAEGNDMIAFATAVTAMRDDLTRHHLAGRLQELDRVWAAFIAWRAAAEDKTALAFLDWYTEREIHDAEKPEEGEGAVKLYSIHAAKGLEWTAVWVLAEDGQLPRSRKPGPGLEEERRLFYVACSRARDRLRMCSTRQAGPSRFIAEALGAVAEVEQAEPDEMDEILF